MCIVARNKKELQEGYVVTNGTRTKCYSIQCHANTLVLAPFVMFYDAKLQLVKTRANQAQYHQIIYANIHY